MQRNNFPTLSEVGTWSGKRVLVRVDFNVPVNNGRVRDDFRIKRSLPTINYLRERGARVILMSHIASTESLAPVSDYLQKRVPHTFVSDFESTTGRETLDSLGEGEVVLLENLRQNPGEKENHEVFAQALANLADVYVNDAFSVSHRAHASVVGVPHFITGYSGLLLEEEIAELSRALSPKHPLFFVLGGAKFETKLPLVERFLGIADTILIGGALANDIYKAQGYNVGSSLVSGGVELIDIAKQPNVIVPDRVIVGRNGSHHEVHISEVQDGDVIADASPGWMESLHDEVAGAKTILWNGPLGNYEAGFREGSAALAQLVASSSAYSIVGGGDTLAVINELGLGESFGFISTGGGAMLDFLANSTLPGIEALRNSGR